MDNARAGGSVTRRRAVASIAIAGALAASGCGSLFPDIYRYRLTVEVDTPQGLKSESSVIQVETREGIGFLGPEASGLSTRVNGEAVAVDFPGGQTLFALLSRSNDPDAAAGYAIDGLLPKLVDRGGDGKAWFHNLKIMRAKTEAAALDPTDYPMLVRFRDPQNPKSVNVVDPGNLAASFGPGIGLKRITVQMTDDPVTKRIEKRLGWLNQLDDYRTDPKNPFTNTLPREISGLRSPMR